ncbi:transglycosylase SLT domain-containing protein [bacterium]|nr:transglycosylase SLT domain-containing protein [bacterium]
MKAWLLVLITLSSTIAAEKDSLQTASAQHINSFQLPDSMEFCGERIPIEVSDVRERLEDAYYLVLSTDFRIMQMLKRSQRYFPVFEKILKEMDVPDDLKFLACAESSLRIDAYSHADAGGLWQFIPSTAKLWGLRVDKIVDERFHVEKSTRAAITMLKSLREQFGSWSMAAAAYNTGQGNINEVIRMQRQNDYFESFLNKETRNYIFHIVVIKELLQHPEKYGFQFDDEDYYEPYDTGTKTITVKGPINDLGKWAIENGTTYKKLKLLNYWIMKYELPAGTWELMLPSDATPLVNVSTVQTDSTTLAQVITLDSVVASSDSQRFYIVHTVREGDYMERIARQYGVSVKDIMTWNLLASDATVLNSKLRIYVPAAKKIFHTVKIGDSLIKIAEQYKVSIDQIKQWNNLSGDVAVLGTNLTIYIGMN